MTTEGKPSIIDKIFHHGKSSEERKHEHVEQHGRATEAPITHSGADALPSGKAGTHAPIENSFEAPVVGPGVNLASHNAL